MAGYSDTRQLIIDTLVGRPGGTLIQPEAHQAFALQITDYVRSVELMSGNSVPISFADEDTVPVQPDSGQAVYFSFVTKGETKTFTYFIDEYGNEISVTSSANEVLFIILLWNSSYWSVQKISIPLTIGVITGDNIANRTITGDKIDSGTIETENIADAAITSEELADDSVVTSKIADKAVTPDKLDTAYLPLTGGTLSGKLNVVEPTEETSAVTKKYVDSQVEVAQKSAEAAEAAAEEALKTFLALEINETTGEVSAIVGTETVYSDIQTDSTTGEIIIKQTY